MPRGQRDVHAELIGLLNKGRRTGRPNGTVQQSLHAAPWRTQLVDAAIAQRALLHLYIVDPYVLPNRLHLCPILWCKLCDCLWRQRHDPAQHICTIARAISTEYVRTA